MRAMPSGFHVVHLVTGREGRTQIEELDPAQAGERLPYLYRSPATSVSVPLMEQAGLRHAFR